MFKYSTITFNGLDVPLYNKENLTTLSEDTIIKVEKYADLLNMFQGDFNYQIIEYFENGKWETYPIFKNK